MNRGRPREFDRQQALRSAMLVFWKKGYRNTSIEDLTAELGISRPSLYAAFVDKTTLFRRIARSLRTGLRADDRQETRRLTGINGCGRKLSAGIGGVFC